MGNYGEYRKALVKQLKARLVAAGAKGVPVRGSRGTAWGWIDISGSQKFGHFTDEERRIVKEVTGSCPGANFWCGEMEDVERILGMSYLG